MDLNPSIILKLDAGVEQNTVNFNVSPTSQPSDTNLNQPEPQIGQPVAKEISSSSKPEPNSQYVAFLLPQRKDANTQAHDNGIKHQSSDELTSPNGSKPPSKPPPPLPAKSEISVQPNVVQSPPIRGIKSELALNVSPVITNTTAVATPQDEQAMTPKKRAARLAFTIGRAQNDKLKKILNAEKAEKPDNSRLEALSLEVKPGEKQQADQPGSLDPVQIYNEKRRLVVEEIFKTEMTYVEALQKLIQVCKLQVFFFWLLDWGT